MYYKVTFEKKTGIYCGNIAIADSAEDVRAHYAKYEWIDIVEATENDVDAAERKKMPIVECPRIENESKEEIAVEEKNIVSRPVWSDAIRGRRAEVWFRRAVSAYDLAARIDPVVTTEARDAAAKLLDSIQRYALADAREWEAKNSSERYCNSQLHMDREKALNKRRERLQKSLFPYRCSLVNYGLYPSIIDNETGANLYALHYFD